MTTLVEFMILSGADNRPPLLDKDLYDSWKSIMELYMKNREHGRMILESVEHCPLIWPKIKENGMTRTKKYEELSATEKIQADCDLKATNIILQGLPYDVFSLVKHHRVPKDLWERIQLLMQGTTLTKQERECNLQSQVNTKFLNRLPPEWSKFVIDVKLVKDLHTTNFDQLNEYLEQHKLHANEVRIMRERSQDPLTLLRNSSNLRQQSTIHDGRVTVQPVQGRQSSFAVGEGRMARQCPKPKRKRDATWFRDKVLLVEVQGYGKVLNEEELAFLADPGVAKGPVTQTVITHNATYQADDLDAYDSDCDDISTAKAVLMANFSSYGSDVLSEKKELLTETFNVLKNESKEKKTKNIDKEIALENKVKELDNIVYKMGQSAQIVHMLTKPQVFYDNNLKQALGFQNTFYLKKSQQIRPMLYDGSVIAKETNVILIDNSEETLMLEEESRSKMLLKQNIVNIVVNSSMDMNTSVNVNSSAAMNETVNYVEKCTKCLELKAKLIKQHNMVEKEIFQKNNTSVNQTEPTFDHVFELNNLKAELQAKDITIEKLKANIKRLNKTSTTNSVKMT
nr:hypothetical protein [Tanacetum cinerariifolium]